MSFRIPGLFSTQRAVETGMDLLDHEILAEKASALGDAGRKVEACMARLNAHQGDDAERTVLLKAAAEAVYAYFVQRELCGFRRHDDVIREYAIPRAVLVRLGAK
jgi:hypothetical protein